MRLQITWDAAACVACVLLAILRWPHLIPPATPTATTRSAVGDFSPPAGLGGSHTLTNAHPDPILAPVWPQTDKAPLIGPGLRNDLDALVVSWDQLRSAMPRPDPWQARVTASLVANLLEDAAYQDAMWLGRDPDPEHAREQIESYYSERRVETVPRIPAAEISPVPATTRPK